MPGILDRIFSHNSSLVSFNKFILTNYAAYRRLSSALTKAGGILSRLRRETERDVGCIGVSKLAR